MLLLSRSWIVVIAVSLVVAGTACQPKPAEKPSAKGKLSAARPTSEASEQASERSRESGHKTAHKPQQQEPPPRPTIPPVALSDALHAACLVNVGDVLPEAELPDAAGNLHALKSLYGQKLAVVCLWTISDSPARSARATQSLKDLMKAVVEPFGKKGVQLVGVNVGNTVEDVRQHVARADATFPNLFDPKGDYVAKLAKDGQMPRIYLVDTGGKVLWFDVEVSRDSLRNLVQGIRVALGEL